MAEVPVLHFFVGKGGAGKTTVSTAQSLALVEDNGKHRVLLVALERNSALGDILRKTLESKPTKIVPGKGNGGMHAVELDLPALGAEFEKGWKAALGGMATKGAVVSEDDVRKLLEASATNYAELAMLFHLQELASSNEWDQIVIDGLATSHVMRLLDVPAQFRKLIALARGEKPTKGNKVVQRPPSSVDAYATKVEGLIAFMKDAARFRVNIVTIAEPEAEVQTRDLAAALEERGMGLNSIIANMIEDGKASREVANRRGLQAPHVRKFQTISEKVELVQRRIIGPRGLDELKKFSKELASGKETKALQFQPAEAPPALVRAPSMPPIAAPPLPPTRFIFFVGSGGVGKSSCAAAAAVTLTEKEGPVLLLSTDPSHSLSEVLTSRLTDTETQVKGTKGLYAREIDIQTWFTNLRRKLRESVEPMFGPESKGEPFALDRDLFRNLLDTAPCSIDELAALCTLTDALVQERFKRIVVDPMPSGNKLRILELPALIRPWLQTVIALATKYKGKGGANLLAWAEGMLKHIDRFEKAILNPAECRFVVTTRGEDLSIPAAERLAEYLKQKNLPVERLLVNRILPKTTCPVTEERRANELEVAKNAEKKIGLPATLAPALGRFPAGLRALKEFRTSWYALTPNNSNKVKAA